MDAVFEAVADRTCSRLIVLVLNTLFGTKQQQPRTNHTELS